MSEHFERGRRSRFELPVEQEMQDYPFIGKPPFQTLASERILWLAGLRCFDVREQSHANNTTLAALFHFALKGDKRKKVYDFLRREEMLREYYSDFVALEIIKPLQYMKVVDFACGAEGSFVFFLKELGATAFGVDDVVREKAVDEGLVIQSGYANQTRHPKLFEADVVTCTQIFPRIELQFVTTALAPMIALLKRGGVLILVESPRELVAMVKQRGDLTTLLDFGDELMVMRKS